MEDGERGWGREGRVVVKDIFATFLANRPFQLAAALGYYTLLSMAPLLLLLIGAAGLIFSQQAAGGQLVHYIEQVMGHQQAQAVQSIIAKAGNHHTDVVSTIIGIVFLLFGATTVFAHIQSALNQIWDIKAVPRHGVIWRLIRARLFSLGVVLAMLFILLASMLVSTVLAGLHDYFVALFPGAGVMLHVIYGLVLFAIVTVLIGLVFRYVPDATIGWREAWIGALITSGLFTAGKYTLDLYLSHSRFSSSYGVAGSLILVVIWVYYTSLILFLGAAVTQVYARRFGTRIRPSAHARFIDPS